MKIFIGGSKTIAYLNEETKKTIDGFCDNNAKILIGDCFGADLIVQQYLCDRGYTNVTVYVSGDEVRHNVGNFPVNHVSVPNGISGFSFYHRKDIAMANDADCGLMIWNGSSRGTESNIHDMKKMGKSVMVIEYDE